MKSVACFLLLSAAAACSADPTPHAERTAGVTVIPGNAAAPSVETAAYAASPEPATAPDPTTRAPAPSLTVEQSAAINTSEMWSEPITTER